MSEMDELGYWWDGKGEIFTFAETGMHVTCQAGGDLIQLKGV